MDYYVIFTSVHKPSENLPRKSIASVVKRYSFQDVLNKFGSKVYESTYMNALKEVKELSYKLKNSDMEHINDRFSLIANKVTVFVPEYFFNNYISLGYQEKNKRLLFVLNERKIMNAWRKAGFPKYWGIEDPALPLKEKKDWIYNFGSKELKKKFRRNQENQKLYISERMEKERPGWYLKSQVEGEEKEFENPPEDISLLEEAKKFDETADFIYWIVDDDDNEEIIIWEGFVVNTKFLGRDILFLPEDFPKEMVARKT